VYADWLQDRSDPRADYIRLQLRINGKVNQLHAWQGTARLLWLGTKLDPLWVGFMSTLAQPFVPITVHAGEPTGPFTEQIGDRGRVVTFESQYRSGGDRNEGLLSDLAFLTGVEWGECAAGYGSTPLDGFLCELATDAESLEDDDIYGSLHIAAHRRDRMTSLDEDQFLFDREEEGAEMDGAHGQFKRYVDGGQLWYASLRLRQQVAESPDPIYRVGLAVGRSPHGNWLAGALTCQSFRDC
jgi:hypothetical protein